MPASSSNLALSASLASASFVAALAFIMGLGARFTFASIEATFAFSTATSARVFLCCCNKAAFSGAMVCGCGGDSTLGGVAGVVGLGMLDCMGARVGKVGGTTAVNAADVVCTGAIGMGCVTGGIGITSAGCVRSIETTGEMLGGCTAKGIGIAGGGKINVGGEEIAISGGEAATGGEEKVDGVAVALAPVSASGSLGLCFFFLCFLSFSESEV